MSSPFQKQFSSKSPLHGAYSSGADGMVTVSDAGHFAKLQNDITGATLASMNPKVSKCEQGAEYYFDKDGAKFVCPDQKNTNNSSEKSSDENQRFDSDLTGELLVSSPSGLSDYKKSNKNNPYYTNNGYESPYTVNLPKNF